MGAVNFQPLPPAVAKKLREPGYGAAHVAMYCGFPLSLKMTEDALNTTIYKVLFDVKTSLNIATSIRNQKQNFSPPNIHPQLMVCY
jgi:hypothetical protein